MDRLEAMNLFVRVAERGSFSAAADQLGVARSVVTRQIAALETHLGVKLMTRSTRRLTPDRLRAAVIEAMEMTPGAGRVAEGFAATGGVGRGADLIEQLTLVSSCG